VSICRIPPDVKSSKKRGISLSGEEIPVSFCADEKYDDSTMNSDAPNSIDTTPSHALLLLAQAAIGCGAGLVVAQKLRPKIRNIASISSFAVGALLAVPLIVSLFSAKINSPATRRGSNKRLRSIREDVGFPSEEEMY